MARIPQQELDRLKAEVSVARLVEAAGVALRKAGKDLLGRCPFHDDAEASLVVTPGKNLWHCFGCQVGGGPVDWVIKTQGVSFRHAVELLREGQPLAAQVVRQSTVPKLPPPVAFDADDQALLAQVVGYYHETLKASPEALAYLKTRGIDHPEVIERFRLGFANRTLGLRLPEKNRKDGAAIRERLTHIGILRASGHEHFNGSLVVPIFDEEGNVTEVYGRKITANLRPGTPLHLYLPGPHRGVWNAEALAASKEVILCEALIDALTFWCTGYRNVTAAYGVEGFTDDHLVAFKKYATERVLLKLEALQDERIRKALEPKAVAAIALSEAERTAALALLRSSNLCDRILADFAACGIVGERTNKLVGYLAAVSRKLDNPLAVVIQSSSAAGKTSLMDAILAFVPEEERVKYSAMTGQSLFYMGSTNLKHKCLAIVEEEGASRASYALKLLQSEGELTIASTGKDPATGSLVTQEYRVEGPVMLFLTTTAAVIDEELQNRCLVFAIDEGREQTRAIHRLQRERRTLDGLLARAERDELIALHRNAQRLIRPLAVLNPYARSLTFPDEATRTRRDHEKYLTLIDTIALLHQYQREVKLTTRRSKHIEYVEVTLDDIALANALAHEVLGRSLDELPPQTRRLLLLLDTFVAEQAKREALERSQVRFSRRELREATGIGDTQLRLHLERLVALEYLLAYRQGAGGKLLYELLYDGEGRDGRPFVPGLIDVDALRATVTTPNSRGQTPEVAGRLRADRGPVAGHSRGTPSPGDPASTPLPDESTVEAAKTRSSSEDARDASYPYPLAAKPAAP